MAQTNFFTIEDRGRKQVILVNDNTRVVNVGEIIDNTFYKAVKKSKHLFKVLDAWGLDSELFNKYLLPKNRRIVVYEKEEKLVYEIDAKEFKENAQYYHFKEGVQDHRTQLFLPRRFWSVSSFEEYKLKHLKI